MATKHSPRDKEALPREDAFAAAKRDTKLQHVQASQMCCLAQQEVSGFLNRKFRIWLCNITTS
jgi:hypothetical protein